jgi:hypothetical protein
MDICDVNSNLDKIEKIMPLFFGFSASRPAGLQRNARGVAQGRDRPRPSIVYSAKFSGGDRQDWRLSIWQMVLTQKSHADDEKNLKGQSKSGLL